LATSGDERLTLGQLGRYDELAIYDRALTAAEVLANFESAA